MTPSARVLLEAQNHSHSPRPFEERRAVITDQMNRDSHSTFDYNAAFASIAKPL